MFEQFAQRYFEALDTTMREVVSLLAEIAPGLGVMLRYPLGWVDEHNQPYQGTTGKRIRPMLLLLCSEAAGGDWHTALPAATAVELLHNFSLIHDDIQDESPMRHGRPAVWHVWGLADAINAGDAMFGLAYDALALLEARGVPVETVIRAWRIFNTTVRELTRGQYLDMNFEHRETVTVEEYVSMITGKSAALLAACTQMGALIASGDDTLAEHYRAFGLNMGIGFQIRDDILGIWGDPAITGKSAATDILSRKKSLPVLYALEQSETLAEIYRREAFGDDDVAEAVAELERLGAQQYAREVETQYYYQAVEALAAANPAGALGQGLRQFLDALFERNY